MQLMVKTLALKLHFANTVCGNDPTLSVMKPCCNTMYCITCCAKLPWNHAHICTTVHNNFHICCYSITKLNSSNSKFLLKTCIHGRSI